MTDFKLSRRTVLGTSALFAAASAFGGLPAFADTRLRLLWWGSQERADRTNKTIEAYKKAASDVSIDGEFLGWNDYWTRLATQVAGRNAPDLIQMDYRYVFEYARRGTLLALDDYLGKSLKIEDFGKDNIDSCRVDGKLYGVNLGVNSSAAFYDIGAWFDAGVAAPSHGMSWQQYFDNCVAFSKANKRKNFYASVDASGIEPSFELWLRQLGKSLYNDQGKLGYTAEDAAAWFQYWTDLRKAGGCVTADIQALDKLSIETNPLTTGYAATGFAHSNQFVGFQKLSKAKLGIAPYPVKPDGKPGHYMKPSMMMSISASTASPDAAVAFVNFMVESTDAAQELGVERGVPASAAMRDVVTPMLDEPGQMVVDYIGKLSDLAGPLPPAPPKGAGEIAFSLQRISQEVAFESSSPAEGGKQLVTEANSILERA